MMEALRSYETSVLTRDTRRNSPEDDILHSHRRENHKSYMKVMLFAELQLGCVRSEVFTAVKNAVFSNLTFAQLQFGCANTIFVMGT
jgi:hypothetical protein